MIASAYLRHAAARAAALLALAVATCVVAPGAAQADGNPLIVCTGTQQVHYSPGLTYTQQTVAADITADYANCTAGPVASATGALSFDVDANCGLTTSFPVDVFTYTFDTGQQSTVTFTTTAVAQLANGSVVLTSAGSVTSGYLTGATATRVVVYPVLNPLACLLPGGLAEMTGVATLTLV